MVQQKDEAIAKQQRRAMAQLIESAKIESARIRVENIIRSDLTTELYEILELYCELLLARAGLLEGATCDPGLEEAVKSIIYAAPRTEIKELQSARTLLVEKFGKEFALEAMENRPKSEGGTQIPDRVVKRLKTDPPSQALVEGYLTEIARTYGVAYGAEEAPLAFIDDDDDDEPGDGEKELAEKEPEEPLTTDELSRATPPRALGPKSPLHIAPPSPSTENVAPRVKLPGPPELKPGSRIAAANAAANKKKDVGVGNKDTETTQKKSGTGVVPGKVPDIDDLAKRFAALKK